MAHRPGIYLILHLLTGKAYIGSSQDSVRRIYLHRRMLRRGEHHSPQLQRAYDRDGEAAFSFAVIERCDSGKLLSREQLWINARQSADPAFGYNVCAVTGTRRGVPQPASYGETMRAVHKGKPKSAEHKAKISAARKGQRKTDEHKAKLAAATREHMTDPERRERQAAYGAMATPHMRGKKHTEESLDKMRSAHAKRPRINGRFVARPRENPAS